MAHKLCFVVGLVLCLAVLSVRGAEEQLIHNQGSLLGALRPTNAAEVQVIRHGVVQRRADNVIAASNMRIPSGGNMYWGYYLVNGCLNLTYSFDVRHSFPVGDDKLQVYVMDTPNFCKFEGDQDFSYFAQGSLPSNTAKASYGPTCWCYNTPEVYVAFYCNNASQDCTGTYSLSATTCF